MEMVFQQWIQMAAVTHLRNVQSRNISAESFWARKRRLNILEYWDRPISSLLIGRYFSTEKATFRIRVTCHTLLFIRSRDVPSDCKCHLSPNLFWTAQVDMEYNQELPKG